MWQIWIDTGGTFTDCIARSPDGVLKRVKVLSSCRLRGQLIRQVNPHTFIFSHNWRIRKDIFRGYHFQLTGLGDNGILVENIDFEKNEISLSRPVVLSSAQAHTFELTAGEEAPVLATRLVTETPLDQPLPPVRMRLGTTKGTNALLEKKVARTALLITKGFKDLLYIGTQQRPNLFQLDIPEPALLYDEVIEVNERIDAAGKVLTPLTAGKLQRLAARVKKAKVESVAVALLHAWRNPAHELALKKALEKAGLQFISLSHALMPAIKILPRAQTAVVNACLEPILNTYLDRIALTLSPAQALTPSLRIMTSAGGLTGREQFNPKDSLLSGPAGGVVGAAAVAESLGFQKVITLDMGGTSTDTARYDGQYDYDFITRIGGFEMLSPCLSIETVAAGGGSVCWFDGNKLCVGPQSAGASPGPASYGAGGPLAITDVNLLLGKLDPSAMGIPVSYEKAGKALRLLRDTIAEQTGVAYTEEELLRGFEGIANEKMAGAIRKISVAKGFDPREYALLAFGGAGGLHACKIAELLGISTIILPYDGGLLSAYGIGRARIERFAQQQVLQTLEDLGNELAILVDELANKATAMLLTEGFTKEETEVKTCNAYLRLKGQESSLEIDLIALRSISAGSIDTAALGRLFEEKYQELFGHFPGNRPVEVESIKVIVSSLSPVMGFPEVQGNEAEPGSKTAKAVLWEHLQPGEKLHRSAILLNAHATAYLEKNWQLEVGPGKNLILALKAASGPTDAVHPSSSGTNPIELELFTNRFAAIAAEMGAQLQRTAFSVNVKERLDFSCALLDPEAALLVNAPHIPVHLGSLGICARLVKEKINLGPGDVVIVNHPKYGGSHLPDVTMLGGVFLPPDPAYPDQGHRLIGYVINRAHHAEIGGKRPGSMPPDAKTLEEEGVTFLPTYLVRNGQARWEAMEALLIGSPYPTRALHENLADINAALASLRTGENKLQQLVAAHGPEKVELYMRKLKETATVALQDALAPFDGQHFSAREKLDDGLEIVVAIAIEKGKVKIDFTGTGPTHSFNLNANISIVYSAVIYVLRLLCRREIPLNEGLMKNVDIVLPEGTFLHPVFADNPAQCPAVVGGNTEVSQRLVDTLLKALVPITKTACSQGTMNNFLFGNERFGYYETICGGTGAGAGFNGRTAVHQHMTNTKITDAEELELRYPVRLKRFGTRSNSGGLGRWRGGDGVVREIEFTEEVEITLISQHRKVRPYGLEKGKPGKAGRQYLVRAGSGRMEKLQGIDSCQVQKGDRVIIETPGGGGFGSPE